MNKRQRKKLQKRQTASAPVQAQGTPFLSKEDCKTLAREIWRIRKSVKTLADAGKASALSVSLEKLEDLLHSLKLEIYDPAGESYSEGMTVSVALFEKTKNLPPGTQKIAETVSPTILFDGRVLQPGRVIVEVGEGEA